MTLEEKVAILEERIAKFEAFFLFHTNPHDGTIGCATSGRFGIMTNYWMMQQFGQGAAFSVGTISDRFAGYFEIDADACPDHPSTGVYASVVTQAIQNTEHIAFEGHAANSPKGNFILFGQHSYAGQSLVYPTESVRLQEVNASGQIIRQVSITGMGIALIDGVQVVAEWFISKVGGVAKKVWP